jgi:membrane protein DedA with SNARE-associated domain
MLGLRYRTFALWTGPAAAVWAVAHVLAGYAAGAGWRQVHHLAGRVGLGLALAVAATLAGAWLLPDRRACRSESPDRPDRRACRSESPDRRPKADSTPS